MVLFLIAVAMFLLVKFVDSRVDGDDLQMSQSWLDEQKLKEKDEWDRSIESN